MSLLGFFLHLKNILILNWISRNWILLTSKLCTFAKLLIKSKLDNPEKGIAPSPTSLCCSYWKDTLRVTLDYGWLFANDPGDLGSIRRRVTLKTQKMVFNSLLNTQYYKGRIKGKVGQCWEKSSTFPYTLV